MKKENLLESRLQEIPKDIEEFVSLSFDVSDRIRDLLEKEDLSQKEFAKLLGKRESEVSKWLKGTHNFTLETIAKISIVLKAKLLYVPTSTMPIDDLKNAIKDFEVLCENRTLEGHSSNIKFTVSEQPTLYKKEDRLKFFDVLNNVSINRNPSVMEYHVAASLCSVECDEKRNKYALV